jgi:transposase
VEAIAEAAVRPTMRFVSAKTIRQQAGAMVSRTRDLFVRQRTQLINALRVHLSEHGVMGSVPNFFSRGPVGAMIAGLGQVE